MKTELKNGTEGKSPKHTKNHLLLVKRQLYANLFHAYQGLWQWHLINRIKGFGQRTMVVLLPGTDRETNYLALLYLDQMLENRNYENAVILTHDEGVIRSGHLFSERILEIKRFDCRKAEHLMQLYCLYEFAPNFICASIDEPYGRNGDRLIGKRGTTKEEIFVIGVYHVYPFYRKEAPVYQGEDDVTRDFMQIQIV